MIERLLTYALLLAYGCLFLALLAGVMLILSRNP